MQMWQEFREIGVRPFFLWHLYFADVFQQKGGFDVVIANPPYVRISGIGEKEDRYIRQKYKTVFGHYDIYIPFIEKGVYLLNKKGILAYITSNKYLTKRYANKLRPFLLNETELIELVDTSRARIFDVASVYPVITILAKKQIGGEAKIAILDDSRFKLFFQTNSDLYDYSINQKNFQKNKNCIFDIFLDTRNRELCRKLENETETLGSYSRILTGTPSIEKFYQWQTLVLPEDKVRFVEKPKLRFINVSNVKPYYIEWGKEIRAVKKRVKNPYLVFDEELVGKNKWNVFCKKKIVIKGNARRLTAAYDEIGYANLSLYAVIFNESYDDKNKTLFHLALLNSKVLNYWYCRKFASTNLAGGYISFNGVYLAQLPIKKSPQNIKRQLVKIVDKILAITKDKDYLQNQNKQKKVKEYEHQIDKLVYKLYDLTAEEIKIIESKNE